MPAAVPAIVGGVLLYFVVADYVADRITAKEGLREAAEKKLGPAPEIVWRLAVALVALLWPVLIPRKAFRIAYAAVERIGGRDGGGDR